MARDIETAGLPSSPDCERYVLGSMLINADAMADLRGEIDSSDFSTEALRRIWGAMCAVYDRGDKVDRVTVSDYLMRVGQIESVGGVSAIVDLDDGMPHLPHLDSWVATIKGKTLLREMIFAAQGVIDRCVLGEDEPQAIFEQVGRTWADLAPVAANQDFVELADVVGRMGLQEFLAPKGTYGLELPWGSLNHLLRGFRPGQMIVLAALPSCGKSSMAVEIVAHNALNGGCPVVFSLEMEDVALYRRMVAQLSTSTVPSVNATEQIRKRQQHAVGRLLESKAYILDSPGCTPASLRTKLRRFSQKRKPSLVVVDYLQLMKSGARSQNRAQEVGENARALKLMAVEFGCPFLVLSQLNREAVKDGKPALHHLRDSGDIEAHADVVLFIHPKEQTPASQKPVTIMVPKQREGPRHKEIDMWFMSESQHFVEMTPEVADSWNG